MRDPSKHYWLCIGNTRGGSRRWNFNQLNLTPPVDPETRLFYERPFRVLGGDRFAEAYLAAVQDEWLKGQPLVGSADQFVDSTDFLSSVHRSQCLANIYED